MTNYDTIYRDTVLTTPFPADASHSEEFRITHAAGLAAVVAAAKAEALEEAATAPAPNFGDSIKDIIARYGSTK